MSVLLFQCTLTSFPTVIARSVALRRNMPIMSGVMCVMPNRAKSGVHETLTYGLPLTLVILGGLTTVMFFSHVCTYFLPRTPSTRSIVSCVLNMLASLTP